MLKSKKGITLVALVVTIVVLLILAGVSINLVLGDNGIINKAKEAKEKSAEANKNDVIDMEKLVQELENAVNSGEAEQDTIPYLPSSDFHYDTTTSVENGLVVADNDGNEYVWVVVPKSLYNDAIYNLNNTKKPKSSEDYDNIEYCLQQYTSLYRNGTDYSDSWAEDTNNEGWFTSEQYTAVKHNMLKSVYENGGFYVGRYEAGTEENRTNNTDKNVDEKYVKPEVTPVSKADCYPYTWITRTQAQKLAESANSGNRTSSLMFGIQWDLVLAFMSKDTTKIPSTDNLTQNSTEIGNYYQSSFKLSSTGKYATMTNWILSSTWNEAASIKENFVDANGNKLVQPEAKGVLVTTGTSEKNKIMNIYDIAGNVWEWTLEKNIDPSNSSALRGGDYGGAGSADPASNHRYSPTENSFCFVGFRIAIY